jgi:hypothetical protein
MTLNQKLQAIDQFVVLMDRQDREVNRMTRAMQLAQSVYERERTQVSARRVIERCKELNSELDYGQYLIDHIRKAAEEMR